MTGKIAFIISATTIILFTAWVGFSVIVFTSPTDQRAARVFEKVVISYVVDGDTFLLSDNTRVRLIGIDAPELGEPLYTNARERLRGLIEKRTVTLESDVSETDRYGRFLRYAFVDGIFLNETLVREGFARVMIIPPDTRYSARILSAESSARREHLGVWSD